MAVLHGEPVKVGEAVFDVSATRGPGIVSLVNRRGIEVRFPSGPLVTYNAEGKQIGNNRTTLFWHDPIITIPEKGARAWAAQRKVGLAVRDAIAEATR